MFTVIVNSSPICSLRSAPLVELDVRNRFQAATSSPVSPLAHMPSVAPESYRLAVPFDHTTSYWFVFCVSVTAPGTHVAAVVAWLPVGGVPPV